jgi:hypothetical protein
MSTLSLRLPTSLHKKLGELAQRDGVSINQLINSAVAEKMAALMTVEYIKERVKRGSRKKFEAVLSKVSNVEPEKFDQLPNKRVERARRTGRSTAKR